MTTRGHAKPCVRCGEIYISDQKHKQWCPTCQDKFISNVNDYARTKKCPLCDKLIHPHNKTCRECRWKPYRANHICPDCGEPKGKASARCAKCATKLKRGSNHPCWKGGRYFNSGGYVMLYFPNHSRATSNGYVREHIKIWMDAYGKIPKGHVIHHLNGVKSDNRLENLNLTAVTKHNTHTLVQAMQARIRELEARI